MLLFTLCSSQDELAQAGIQIVIYANQLIRSAYSAMVHTAQTILQHGRALEAEQYCTPIKEMITSIPGGK